MENKPTENTNNLRRHAPTSTVGRGKAFTLDTMPTANRWTNRHDAVPSGTAR